VLRAADLALLPKEARADFIARLSPEEAVLLPYFWEFWARPEQLLPIGDWVYWLPLGGRGCGKTRTGAEAVRRWIKTNAHVNIIGATADDVRDIMVEGESGILNVCPSDERPKFVSARNRLEWPNGAKTLLAQLDELKGKMDAINAERQTLIGVIWAIRIIFGAAGVALFYLLSNGAPTWLKRALQ